MRILISNDDGVSAPGIHALAKEFSRDCKVVIVAPERERSTTGHALTLHKPLRLYEHGKNIYSVSGGPADCIYVGVNEVLKGKRPDLILSGINRGANLGQDVFYSGTASAAREAANLGIPSLAVSLSLDFARRNATHHYATAARFARKALVEALAVFGGGKGSAGKAALKKWPAGMMLNVNVPNLPYAKVKGLRAATQGHRIYATQLVKRDDGRGRDYFWLGGSYAGYRPIPESDCWYVDHGYASVTPLELDTTHATVYQGLKDAWGARGTSGKGAGKGKQR